ncbi:hypothetical protein [Vibrio metschnikovii]|uniref:hypothetical protein n=1 Tax=Vibrio metschnikovii TaxID=28172 RepID=UPI001C300582|nr:hypothetical protein [Vibrio metschnikovii]
MSNYNALTDIIANAAVSKNQARELADKQSNPDLKTKLLVIYYALEKMETLIQTTVIGEHNAHSKELSKLQAKLLHLVTERDSAKQDKQNTLDALNEQAIQLSAMTLQLERQQQTTEQLKQQLEQAKQSAAAHTKAIKQLKREHQQAMVDAAAANKEKSQQAQKKLKDKIASQQSTITELKKETEELARDLRAMNGAPVSSPFAGKSKGVTFSISEFSSPITLRFKDETYIRQLPNANWHYQVSRNNGVSIDVGTNDWLMPVLQECNDFIAEWNPKINKELHQIIMTKAKSSHPEYYQAVLAAKKITIVNDPVFTDEERALLQKAKLITLMDAACLALGSFINTLRVANKNVTDEQGTLIRDKVEKLSKAFREQHFSGVAYKTATSES